MADGDGPRVVATFGSYAEMLEAIRERVNELQIQGERFDDYAGLPTGYLSILVGARPIRLIGNGFVRAGPERTWFKVSVH